MGRIIQFIDLGNECGWIFELAEDGFKHGAVISTFHQLWIDMPQLKELFIITRDLAMTIHHKDSVGRTLERGIEQRIRFLK